MLNVWGQRQETMDFPERASASETDQMGNLSERCSLSVEQVQLDAQLQEETIVVRFGACPVKGSSLSSTQETGSRAPSSILRILSAQALLLSELLRLHLEMCPHR